LDKNIASLIRDVQSGLVPDLKVVGVDGFVLGEKQVSDDCPQAIENWNYPITATDIATHGDVETM